MFITLAVTFILGSVALVAYQRHLVIKYQATVAVAILTALNNINNEEML